MAAQAIRTIAKLESRTAASIEKRNCLKIVSLIVSYEDVFLKKKELFGIDEYEDLMKECIFAPDFAVSPVGPAVHYMIKGAYWRFSSACKLRNFTPERKNDNSNRLRVRSYSRMHAPWPLWAFGA